jgi:hypothetical protein
MQVLARARENPPEQEQLGAMEKTMRRTIGTIGKSARVLTPTRHPRDTRLTMKTPADEQRRATVARIRD